MPGSCCQFHAAFAQKNVGVKLDEHLASVGLADEACTVGSGVAFGVEAEAFYVGVGRDT